MFDAGCHQRTDQLAGVARHPAPTVCDPPRIDANTHRLIPRTAGDFPSQTFEVLHQRFAGVCGEPTFSHPSLDSELGPLEAPHPAMSTHHPATDNGRNR